MAEKKVSGVVIGAIFGIVGVVVGSVATGLMNAYLQERQQRLQEVLESFRFDIGNYPVEFLRIKQLSDQMRYLTTASSETIVRLAELSRKYPNCYNNLSEECQVASVESLLVVRQELGSGVASAEDIHAILRPRFELAEQSIQRLRKKGWNE